MGEPPAEIHRRIHDRVQLGLCICILAPLPFFVGHAGGLLIVPAAVQGLQALHVAVSLLTLVALRRTRTRHPIDRGESDTSDESVESDRRYERIAGAVSDGAYCFRLEPNGAVVAEWLSDGFARLTGRAPEEGAEVDWSQWVHPDDIEVATAHTECLRNGTSARSEYRIATEQGDIRWLRDCARPWRDPDGIVRLYGGAQDITERKHLEHLKDDMLSTLSHELRTPLTSMRGFVELLLKRDVDAKERAEYLAIVHEEILRLHRLIDDILDLRRLESGQGLYRFQHASPADLTRSAAELFQKAATAHPLHVAIADNLPTVRADIDRIHQVLTNLLSNATKFSPEASEIELNVRANESEIIFEVADQGIGIPEDQLPNLFHKYARVDSEEARKIGGTGLGLVLVREIVEAHGGFAWATSQPGEGSVFAFTLPVHSDDADAAPMSVAAGGG